MLKVKSHGNVSALAVVQTLPTLEPTEFYSTTLLFLIDTWTALKAACLCMIMLVPV